MKSSSTDWESMWVEMAVKDRLLNAMSPKSCLRDLREVSEQGTNRRCNPYPQSDFQGGKRPRGL